MPASVTKDLAEIAWRYRHKGVAGFDLAGPENGFSSKDHKVILSNDYISNIEDAFDLVRAKCVNVTLHSGYPNDKLTIRRRSWCRIYS